MNCNGFCGEQECKENQQNCKRLIKKLSDEEIEEIIRKHWNREYGNRNMMTFARAIIKEMNR